MKEELLYAHNDPKAWGKQFVMAAGRAGRKAILFNRSEEVPPLSRCFVRLDQEGDQRQLGKDILIQLSVKGCITLPTLQESAWYDDKIQQLPYLKNYMPETKIFFSEQEARQLLDRNGENEVNYPFISKTLDGSASKGVRLIENKQQAFADLGMCFSKAGKPSVYNRIQKGYVYWQEYLPDNDVDYRVCVNGNHVYGLIRSIRSKQEPFASGSGKIKPLILNTFKKDRASEAVELAIKISREIKTDWMAYDIVYNRYGAPKVLEMSSSWTPQAYATCPAYSYMSENFIFEDHDKFGGHMFDFAVSALARKEA